MSFDENEEMSFEDYAKFFMDKAKASGDNEQVHDEELERMLKNYPWYKGMEDGVERARRLGASKYDNSNYQRSVESYQESPIKKFLVDGTSSPLESKDKEFLIEKGLCKGRLDDDTINEVSGSTYRRSAQINMEDLRLTKEDLERLGYNKDGKLVTTIQLTRTKFFEEKDPPSEQVDPMRIAWVKPYIYSPKYQTGIIILFNNGEFRTYTQSFEYFKHKVQQVVGNMVVVGLARLPSLPWWDDTKD